MRCGAQISETMQCAWQNITPGVSIVILEITVATATGNLKEAIPTEVREALSQQKSFRNLARDCHGGLRGVRESHTEQKSLGDQLLWFEGSNSRHFVIDTNYTFTGHHTRQMTTDFFLNRFSEKKSPSF